MSSISSPKKRVRRVLIIVENLPLPFDRRVWQEAQTLNAHGYDVSIICPKGWGFNRSFELIDGVRIYRHPLPVEADSPIAYGIEYGLSLFWQFALSVRIALSHGFDVIQACNPPDTIFLIGRLYKLFGKAFIFDHHDINPELYEAKFRRRDVWYRLLRLLERWTFAAADVSIATNESFREIAITRGGMSADRVFVVRSGPDLTRLEYPPPDAELKRGRRYLVGYVGVIGKQEGLDLLLEAAAFIRSASGRNDIQYVVVGDGTEVPSLKRQCERMGLSDCFTFTGRLTGRELWQVLSTADVCVSPDRVNDMNDKSTMNKVLEYMAFGKPIVQFDLTEGRRSAGEAALYAAPDDAMDLASKLSALLDDAALRRKMGEIGRLRVEQSFAWEHQVPNLLAAYELVFREPASHDDSER